MRSLLLITALFGSAVYAHPRTCDFPQSNQYFPEFSSSGLPKHVFEQVINHTMAVYGPIAQREGAELVFNNLWSDGTVNSDTYLDGNIWYVDAFGGLARYPGMTAHAYQLVLCHEIGHHMGGQPRFSNNDWASVEGEADYWATMECMKRVGVDGDSSGLTLARVFASLSGEAQPQVATPDLSQVAQTYEDHPGAQCRLDTYRAGKRDAARPGCWFAGN